MGFGVGGGGYALILWNGANFVNFLPNLVCALILWRSRFEMLMQSMQKRANSINS